MSSQDEPPPQASRQMKEQRKRPQSTNKKLPLSRVKKIAKMDEDVVAISNAAALIISGATVSIRLKVVFTPRVLTECKEKFAAYFAEQSFFFTLAEKKKGISYKHCASAVARLPQLDFLADVVPLTTTTTTTGDGPEKKGTKRQEGRTNNQDGVSGNIPAWARAHPEALRKIQAAQDQETDTEIGETVNQSTDDAPRLDDEQGITTPIEDSEMNDT